ncbi:MAG: hypothetical protein H6Q06_2939 [Acidobacteria bacterium]|nr:hypothetical protein [Acidobacteriota bacterium]
MPQFYQGIYVRPGTHAHPRRKSHSELQRQEESALPAT